MRWAPRIFVLMLVLLAGTGRAASESEVRAAFAKFVAAQNTHDLKAVTFLIAPAGQTAQPMRVLMNMVFVKVGEAWKVSSILPIPAPQP